MHVARAQNFHDFVLDALGEPRGDDDDDAPGAYSRAASSADATQARTTMEQMNVFDAAGRIADAEWRVAQLYMVLKFVKRRDVSVNGGGGAARVGSGADGAPAAAPPDEGLVMKALLAAKKNMPSNAWKALSSGERKLLQQQALRKLLAA